MSLVRYCTMLRLDSREIELTLAEVGGRVSTRPRGIRTAMTSDILIALVFGAGIIVGYGLAFLYIRIRDGRQDALKAREPHLDRL
jgi:hypothetical protein